MVDIQKEVDPSKLIGTSSKGYKIEYQKLVLISPIKYNV